nr:hypothetical protein [uncultured Acetatifactor sp.]
MPVMDEFREEREALKHGTLKQKFRYFLDYYKWYVVAAVAIVGFAASMIYNMVTRKDMAFSVSLINAFDIGSGDEYLASFAEYAGIDTEEFDIMADSSMQIDYTSANQNTAASIQKLMVLVAAGEIDALLSDEAVIEQYAYSETFYDLRDVLTAEQLDAYGPYLFYMDQAVADAVSEAQMDPNYESTAMPERPDPRKPEAMEQPVPVGICLGEAQTLNETYVFLSGEGILAVPATSPHLETVSQYVDFLLQ